MRRLQVSDCNKLTDTLLKLNNSISEAIKSIDNKLTLVHKYRAIRTVSCTESIVTMYESRSAEDVVVVIDRRMENFGMRELQINSTNHPMLSEFEDDLKCVKPLQDEYRLLFNELQTYKTLSCTKNRSQSY